MLWHADEATAHDNAARLRRIVEEGTSAVTGQPWSERLGVETIDVEGPWWAARLRSPVPIAYRVLVERDTLIMIAR